MQKARGACAGLDNSWGRIRRESRGVNRAFERLYSPAKCDLPVLKVGFTLFYEGRHAFFLIMGSEHALEKTALITNALG